MIFLFFALLIVISGCSADNVVIYSNGNKIHVNVEIAETHDEKAKGLMFRESLCDNCGMLFVFGDLDYRSFWMKNTLIPLDIIFVDDNFLIVDIKYEVPCTTEICDTYSNKAKYVLEVNGGFTKENNINVGDKIVLK